MTAASVPHPDEGFVIQSGARSTGRLLHDLWRSRRLMALLARKDFFVRYRRASFGMLWAVGLPLAQALVLSVVFSRIVRIETGTNYPTFLFAGVLPWSFFSQTVGPASSAIVDGQNLATKIYFPRAVLPLVLVGANLYSMAPGIPILLGMCLLFDVGLGPDVLWLLPGVALAVTFTSALGLVLSALHVYFRDVRYILQAALMAWFYVSPIIYPLELADEKAPEWLSDLLRVNPLAGIIELFRAGTVGADPGWLGAVAASCVWAVVLTAVALLLHRRFDRVCVDLL